MLASAVIGANYGDEGKGLITDYLTRKYNSQVVVRFNGGAQAGHTVQTDTHRHVFSHVSAGTFAGSNTYLGKKFIINSYLLENEVNKLGTLTTLIYGHPGCKITTIYDMAINAVVESLRSTPHGSCGVGINETVARHQCGFELTLSDVLSGSILDKIQQIHTEWIPARLRQHEITEISPELHEQTGFVLLNSNYEAHASIISNTVNRLINVTPLKMTGHILFEGGQGLSLDEDLGFFPHVTRSKTGLPYVIDEAEQFGITEIQPVYVTRAFVTRHGAGPLEHVGEHITDNVLIDSTNVPNQFQGTLRYAPLNLNKLCNMIMNDLNRIKSKIKVHKPVLAVTWMDQLSSDVTVYHNDKKHVLDVDNLIEYIEAVSGFKVKYIGNGPTATLVVEN